MVCSRCSRSRSEICCFREFKRDLVPSLYREGLLVRPPCRTVARLKKSTATTTYRRGGKGAPLPPPLAVGRTQPASTHLGVCRSAGPRSEEHTPELHSRPY